MTAIAMNYVVNPFSRFFRAIQHTFLIAGHARAAAELARMGYHAEAKSVMMQLKELKKESY